ncbi:MAG: hypothetical protein ABIG85_07810 [Chloroflexota bacterium]
MVALTRPSPTGRDGEWRGGASSPHATLEWLGRRVHHRRAPGGRCHRLVGRFVDADAAQVGYLPFDFKRRRWANARDWKWRGIAVERDMLPDLGPTGDRLGELTPVAAAHLGLPAGCP